MEPVFFPRQRSPIPRAVVSGMLVLLILAGVGYLFWYGGSWSEEKEWESKNSDLKMECLNLEAERDSLQAERDDLQIDLESLQIETDNLQQDYDDIREWYLGLRESVNSRLGDGRDAMLFVTPDDDTVARQTLSVTGGFSQNVIEQWADFKRIYDWVVDNIMYSYDSPAPVLPRAEGRLSWQGDFWRMPRETIEDGFGDCEDIAALLASMVRNYTLSEGYPCWVIVFNSPAAAHAAVAFPVDGGELTILDPAGLYYTGQPQDLRSSSVSEAVQDWLDYWSDECPSAHVCAAFSDTDYETFYNTYEFVLWASS